MKISYNWLGELMAGKLPPPKKLADLFDAHSFEVESLEKAEPDTVFDLAVLPNRAHDCLSHIGVAKEAAAILKSRIKKYELRIKESKKIKVGDFISINIKDPGKCLFYAARVILGVKVAPLPKRLSGRLEALEQKSINNVVDATNYAMLLLGQPLHAFDLDKIGGKKIVVRRARHAEKIETLGGGAYELSGDDLVIADERDALAVAGIKGGVKAEVTGATKNIVLEAAYFDPVSTRRTSRRIGLRTDASVRFENGVVPAAVEKALDFAAALIAELAGGEIAAGVVKAGRAPVSRARVSFTILEIEKLLGIRIPEQEILDTLKLLGFEIKKAKKGFLAVAPEERLDISGAADLAEEVGRIYGLANIPSILPAGVLLPAPRNDKYVLGEKIRSALSGLGFCEAYNRSFVSGSQLEMARFDEKAAVKVANPLSLENEYLRPSLLIHFLRNTADNFKHSKSVRLFELGSVFESAEKKVKERSVLGGVLAGKGRAGRPGGEFYELKGALDALLEKLGLDDFWYDGYVLHPGAVRGSVWHAGRAAEVKIGNRAIGVIGEISPQAARDFGIEKRVAAFEISVPDLVELSEEKIIYSPISKFPAVERDIAVLAPAETKADHIQEVIEVAGGELLTDSDLFDIYEGEHLEAERKSLAFHLIFQSPERTLTDREVDAIFEKIVEAVESEGWEVR